MNQLMRVLLVAIVAVLVTAPVLAQPSASGPKLSGFIGSGRAHSDGAVAGGFSLGYRFVPGVEVEFDVAYVSHLDFGEIALFDFDSDILQSLLPTGIHVRARTFTVLANYVGELPFGDRVRPYLVAGGGVAMISERLRFVSDRGLFAALPFTVELPSFPPALNAGGGVDVSVVHGLGIGADLRYLRLFLDARDDVGVVRLVARASYRF